MTTTVRAIISPQAIIMSDKRAAQKAKTEAKNAKISQDKLLNIEFKKNLAEVANLLRHLPYKIYTQITHF